MEKVYFVPRGPVEKERQIKCRVEETMYSEPEAVDWDCSCLSHLRQGPCKDVIIPYMKCQLEQQLDPNGDGEVCSQLRRRFVDCYYPNQMYYQH